MKLLRVMIPALGFLFFVQAAQAHWTAARRLTSTSGYSWSPVMAVDSSGNLHVVWEELSRTYEKCVIYYMKSTDKGATWTAAKRLTSTSGRYVYPDITADSFGNLHVVCQDTRSQKYAIYYMRSTNNGATWTAAKKLAPTSGSYVYFHPAIVADSFGNLYIVCVGGVTDENGDIYCMKSTNNGGTWTVAKRLTPTSGSSIFPDIAVNSSGNLHLVWMDEEPGNYEIYYKRSTKGGTTWTGNRRLSSTLGSSWYPDIAVDSSGNLHVVWEDEEPGNYEIYYIKSTSKGTSWTTTKSLTSTKAHSLDPAIAADSFGNLHVVWKELTAPDKSEIYFMKSTDKGDTWTALKRLTSTSGRSDNPDIAADSSGNLHVVWEDEAPGNDEIYYMKYIK